MKITIEVPKPGEEDEIIVRCASLDEKMMNLIYYYKIHICIELLTKKYLNVILLLEHYIYPKNLESFERLFFFGVYNFCKKFYARKE